MKRARGMEKKRFARLASSEAVSLPPQAPPFLEGLPEVGDVYEPKQTATKQLQKIIEECAYGDNFKNSIEAVSKRNIPELSEIETLDQFYFYVDALVTWIPEIRVWDWDGEIMHERTVYLRITQFYYYFNQPQLESLQSPIAPLEGQKLTPISKWLREFAVQWGEFLDTKESREYLESFKYAPEYAWQDYEKKPEDYGSFNEYFARTFRDIDEQRPVARISDDHVVVFPVESTYVGQWAVSTPVGDPLPAPPSIVVKHIEWSIKELLQDSEYAEDFKGGTFCHTFLNTYDYHRQHTAVSGKVLEAKFIPGQVYLEVELKKVDGSEESGAIANAVVPNRLLDADDPTGYQFVQCRGLLVLESAIGKVAILPMGMAQVSSVVFVTPKDEGHEPILLTANEKEGLDYDEQVEELNKKIDKALVGKHLDKGEMFSYFQFGGSDCVVVFERKANVNLTAKVNTHYNVRSQMAISNINE
ncbi:MAG: phosphatidylserine decarboxylase [bacterium]|nr:phosphatidylserine decarboxylase [bacterium]